MGNVTINYLNGGIGGVIASQDGISGFIFDSTELPSGFSSDDRIKAIYSIKEAENLGIVNTSIDETKATGGEIEITGITGYTGFEIVAYVTPVNGPKTKLGSTKITSVSSISSVATALALSITLGGIWSATAIAGAISLVAPSGLGESINGAGVLSTELSSGIAYPTSITPFSGGVGSEIDIMHYTLASYFKANSQAKAWVGVYDYTSGFSGSTIALVQSEAEGEIRQLGIWMKSGLENVQSVISECQSGAADQVSKKKPLSVVLAMQGGSATLSTLTNIKSLTSPLVSVTISNGYGTSDLSYLLKGRTGYYPTDLGDVLGHISRSKVSYSIAWVEQNKTQYTDTMLVTGDSWKSIADSTRPTELEGKGYIFERKYTDFAGSYFNSDSTADAVTSDYDSIKRNRVMHKIGRLSNLVMTPYLSSPINLNANGTISQATLSTYQDSIVTQLTPMFNSGEVSAFAVFIDPTQNVLVSKELGITITVVPIGSADNIVVNLGYALSLV